jgi:nucleotide-binding universal stress UspA family protein
MFRSILVPLDGSSFGEQALPLALSIARRNGAALTLMHVHRFLDVYYGELQPVSDTLEESLRKQEKAYLEHVAQRIREAGPIDVTTVLDDGQVAAQVRQHAVETKIDLVVMTTHARGALGRFWLGSTADELVRELPMPVLLVHPAEKAADITHDLALKNVLVPLDGTPLAEQILEPASSLSKLFGADITLMRVVQPLMPTSVPVGTGTFSEVALHMAEDIDKLQKQVEQGAFDYLEKAAAKLRAEKTLVKTMVVLAEQPGVGILKEAQEIGTDLIALATHGRRGLARLFLGSVADKVLRGSHVPVLVHRPRH